MQITFEGKRVLVTGGANGLGKGIVISFLNAGATVIALDRDEDKLVQLKEEFPSVIPLKADLSNWNETRDAVQSVLPIHHLVNNAAIFLGSDLIDTPSELIDSIFNINFKAYLNVSQVFVKSVQEKNIQGATIVNISSTGDRIPQPYGGIYCCSKAAITMLSKCMALEFGPNIRVNTVRPSAMPTTFASEVMQERPAFVEAAFKKILDRTIISRPVELDEVSNLVLFLSSEKSSMITGEDILVDGGFSVQ